jgi:putative NADH-flavin reductase
MTTKVLVLGAGGAIAQHVINFFKGKKNIELTLFARNTNGFSELYPNVKIIKGDVLNKLDLDNAIKGQDIVYANLSGQIDKMAGEIVKSMENIGIKRLIFISALGIYNEIPGKFGQWNCKLPLIRTV